MAGEGQVIDVSVRGCGVESEMPLSSGTYLELRVSPPDHDSPVEVELARVQWSRGGKFGTEFVRMQAKDEEHLRRFVMALQHQR